MDFDGGKSIPLDHWIGGVGPKNEDFLGSEMATSEVSALLCSLILLCVP